MVDFCRRKGDRTTRVSVIGCATQRDVVELFQIQMGFSFPFLLANYLRSSLLNIKAHSFLLSCKYGVNTQG